jgi:plasmid stabilization system protein ParE
MKTYKVYVSDIAQLDLNSLTDYIAFELKSPITSLRYTKGIIAEMQKIKTHAESISVSTQKSILQYAHNARRVNYKKHAVIYTVNGETVVIHRILASAMIKK